MIHILDTVEKIKTHSGLVNCGVAVKDDVPIAAFWDQSNVCKKCFDIHKSVVQSGSTSNRSYAFYTKE